MQVYSEEVALALPPPLTPRSPGVHLSGIIRCLAAENGILKPEWAEELSLVDARTIVDPVAVLRISIGLAWEQWYIAQLQGVSDHPGEIQLDGVYMTPDGESVDLIWNTVGKVGSRGLWPFKPRSGKTGYQLIGHEVKSTYKSMNTVGYTGQVFKIGKRPFSPLETQLMWLWQMAGYGAAMETCFWILHVLFLCGDYQFPIRPRLLRYYVEFEPDEIQTKWQLLKDYRDYQLEFEEDAP